jgi:hypothetical protein
MPLLGVCGDSFLAATQDLPYRADCNGSGGKHFTEILSKRLGYDYFTLARGACSNTAIRFQIDEVIKQKCDFVIVGTTGSNRIEYPITDGTFENHRGIYNIIYDKHPDISSLNSNFVNTNTVSETLTNILAGYGQVKDEEQLESIKRFVLDIYHEDVKKFQDAWIISDGIRALREAKIPYIVLCVAGMLDLGISTFDKPNKRVLRDHVHHRKMLPYYYNTWDEESGEHSTRRWHVSDKNQVVICDHLCDYIQTHNLLDWSDNE